MIDFQRLGHRRSSDAALAARADFDAWRRQKKGTGLLLLAGAPRMVDGITTPTKPLAIPLFCDHDLDGLIDALVEPAEKDH